MVLVTATTVGLLIPLFPGGIGTYEAAGVYVLQKYGYGFDEALVLSLVLHVSQLMFFFIGSLIIASSEHIGIMALLRRIRTLADKNENGNGSVNLSNTDVDAAPVGFPKRNIRKKVSA